MDKKSNIEDLFQIRDVTFADYPFIYSTWLKGLYYGNEFFKQIDIQIYYQYYQKALEQIYLPKSKIQIACLKDDPDVILGYSIFEETDPSKILHWVFVKPAWRKLGIAKKLIPSQINTITHLTKVGQSIKPKSWIFNPFLI